MANPVVEFIVDGSGPNGTFVPGDDLDPAVKQTIGSYLQSTLSQNQEPVGQNYSNSRELLEYSDSGYFDASSPTLGSFLKKGTDGNTFLDQVQPLGGLQSTDVQLADNIEQSLLQQKIYQMLDKFNRETPTHAHAPLGKSRGDYGAYQGTLGAHISNNSADHPKIDLDSMRRAGISAMLAATGHKKVDPDSDTVKSRLPSAVQLGAIRISPTDMLPRNGVGAPPVLSLQSDLDQQVEDPKLRGSYGSLNHPDEPFSGLAPAGMIALAVALMAPLQAATEALGLLGLIPHGQDLGSSSEIKSLGTSSKTSVSILGNALGPQSLGFVQTRHDFFKCLDKGADVFFGLNKGVSFRDVLAGATDEFLQISQSPGFYVVFVRSILRSANELAGDISKVGSDVGAGDILAAGSSLGAAVQHFKSSKIVAYLNMIATFGDIQLFIEESGLNDKAVLSSIDSIPNDTPASHVMKTRQASGDLRLSWRDSSTESMFLLPKSAIVSDFLINGGKNSSTMISNQNTAIKVNRISSEDVAKLEDNLESEYVPFYFHDVRTNEIVSFHAFLSSLTDEFSPSYEEVDGYGRIDSVMIYGGTKRSIGLSFYAVSTNIDDFNAMWQKINKMVTMVYPQFDQGRAMKTTSDSSAGTTGLFIQPFSQVIAASPLIRLRVGDIIKSNYSKFNLSRIFGLGTDNFSLADEEGQKEINNAKLQTDALDANNPAQKQLINRMTSLPTIHDPLNGFLVFDSVIVNPGTYTVKTLTSTYKLNSESAFKAKVQAYTDSGFAANSSDYVFNRTYEVVEAEGGKERAFLVHFSDLSIDYDYVVSVSSQNNLVTQNPTTNTEVMKFFDAANNPIVRSFESAMGKGLAGFITNLSFEWIDGDSLTWEVSRWNSRAPRMAKITLTFKPIHDIAPGLDSDGFNRAPVYNVGDIVRQMGGDPRGTDSGKDSFEKARASVSYRSLR